MPLTKKGKKIKRAMMKEYDPEKGERVFYMSENKGTIKGVKKHGGMKRASRNLMTGRMDMKHITGRRKGGK